MSLVWIVVITPITPIAPVAFAAPAPAEESAAATAQNNAAELWADYVHYVKVVRDDLAAGSARALLDSVTDDQLLDIVETGRYPEAEWRAAFDRAMKRETLQQVTQELAQRIQAARIARSRDPERIAKDIELLAGTTRERQNAIERLRAAGQFAASQMLQVLLDPAKSRLHPHVESAMVTIGRPLVYPLSVALVELEPVQAGQIARILGQIGYPFAIPFVREVVERPTTDESTSRILQTAYTRLASAARLPEGVSAAELYLTLGRNYYDAGAISAVPQGYDAQEEQGIVWRYERGGPLLAVPSPASIFADVMAMRIAQRALTLDPRMDPALSLWLGANLRRENRLLPDETDLLAPPREAMYYARMAGPLRLHDILDRALNDNDPVLALDTIAGLQASAGTEALINRRGGIQPLLRALSYPDRNVRFAAAFVMTQTRPQDAFPGSDGVVLTLADAVRQSNLKHAVAIADDQQKLNRLISSLQEHGYSVVPGASLGEVNATLAEGAPVDVVIADLRSPQLATLHEQVRQNNQLASVPLVAIVTESEQPSASLQFRDDRRTSLAVVGDDSASLSAAIEQSIAASSGQPINAEQASEYASVALNLLREVALGNSPVYNVADAEPAVIDALNDPSEDIVVQAGQVLELIDSQAAQLAIAQAAFDQRRSEPVRIALLNSLAESAKHFGNKLGQIQVDNLLQLVKSGSGDLALAAARAHGALTLPTANAVELIIAHE